MITADDLTAPDPATRLQAIASCVAAGRPEAIAVLVACWKHDPVAEVREAAAAAAQALSAQIHHSQDPYGVFRL